MTPIKKTSTRTKLLAFAPALLTVGLTAFVASGASVVPGASAASAVSVSGSITSTITTSPTTGAGGGATGCVGEGLTGFAAVFAKSDGCDITFSTNGVNGAQVTFENANVGDAAFFCSDGVVGAGGTRSCATNSGRLEDLVGKGQTIPAASDSFGLALTAVSGDGGVTFGSGIQGLSGAAPTGASAVWSGIPASGSPAQLCKTTGPNTTSSTCNVVFGGSGAGTTQGAGDYSGTMNVTAADL